MRLGKRKRTTYKRKRSFKKRTNRKIARVGTVKRMMARQEESHWRTITNNVNTGFNAPDMLLLNGLTKGADRFNRLGNQIHMVSIEMRIVIAANSTNRGVNRARLIVFLDKQPNAGYPTSAQLFADVTGAYDTTTMQTPLHPDYFGKRYKLLRDITMTVGQEGGAVDYSQEKTYKLFIPLRRITAQYNDSNVGSIADFIKNSLLAFCISDESSTGAPTVTIKSLFRWKDN